MYVGDGPVLASDPLGLFQARRVAIGVANLAGAGLGVWALTTGTVGTAGLAAPAAISAATGIAVMAAFGMEEFLRGILEPAASSASSIPAPYLSTVGVIVATGGNLEVASAYNNITSAYNAGKTAMDYASGFRELSNPELAKNVLDLTKAGYLNPPLPPGWGKGAQGNFCPAPGR